MEYNSDGGRVMVRDEDSDRSGLRADLDRLTGELGAVDDYLLRLTKRLDPVLVPDAPTEPSMEGGLKSISEVGSRSEVRAQVQGLIRTASRLTGRVNGLIGRVDL